MSDIGDVFQQASDASEVERRDKEAEIILTAWRNRFPMNMYAWPGSPKDFAIEASKALRAS